MVVRPTVSAEVLLHRSRNLPSGTADRVAGRLRGLGLKIVSVSDASISVEASADVLERVLQVRLVQAPSGPKRGFEYGSLGGPELLPDRPPSVPEDLRDEVESIEIQPPPSLL